MVVDVGVLFGFSEERKMLNNSKPNVERGCNYRIIRSDARLVDAELSMVCLRLRLGMVALTAGST